MYPLLVTILLLTIFVAVLPIIMVVSMSISSFSRFFSVVIFVCWPSLPACFTIPTGVFGFMCFVRIS